MSKLNEKIKQCKAFAPATCANVAVGFDILGFAIEGIGDQVTLTKRDDQKIVITDITGLDIAGLPMTPSDNTATAVIAKCCNDLDIRCGFDVKIDKGIPVGSGMGGSAASSVAAMVALNGFLKEPLAKEILAEFAIFGEQVASGTAHADNVVPSLYGGFTLTWKTQPLRVLSLPIPPVYVVLVHPAIRLDTREAREFLPEKFELTDIVNQTGHLALMISAVHQQDMELLSESLEDVLIEPHRAKLVPGFNKVKEAALEAGAIGASLSGAGPTLFALVDDKTVAERAKIMMIHAFEDVDVHAEGWTTRICNRGAHLINGEDGVA